MFIKLTHQTRGTPILINADQIVEVYPGEGEGAVVYPALIIEGEQGTTDVQETLEEIWEMVRG